jgi:predicted  nucleic acid-binding Zn-ribbon protein
MSVKEAKLLLSTILNGWDEFSTRLKNMKEKELEVDLFSQIDFLSQLDEVQGTISSQMIQLEKHLSEMKEHAPSTEDLSFKKESQQVLKDIQSKLTLAEESYREIAEEVLHRSEDRINELTDKILEHHQDLERSKKRSGLELDEENELRDLRDSLESYREIRMENILNGVGDPILDQLDSQMLASDSALLIDESSV